MKTMKSMLFATLGILLALSMVLTFCKAVSAAAPYPSRPVRIIVPEAPGGGTDIIARLFAPKLSERLGKPVIAENRSGAGGLIATEMVAKADPDGYTLMIASAKHTIQPAFEKLPYDPVKSFAPIAMLGGGPFSLSVNPNVPANSVKELIALAKQKPGQLIFGSAGLGTTPHVSAEFFKMLADIDYKIVHFKGVGPALTDLLGGHSHALFSSIPGQLPHIKSGKLRVIGTGGVKRSVFLPDVPTVMEAGLPGFKSTGWFGILTTAGTPAPIVDRLSKELKEILASDEVRNLLLNNGMELDYLGPTEYGTFLEEEITRWADVVKKANIKME